MKTSKQKQNKKQKNQPPYTAKGYREKVDLQQNLFFFDFGVVHSNPRSFVHEIFTDINTCRFPVNGRKRFRYEVRLPQN